MRFLIAIFIVLSTCNLYAGDVNRKICIKGFERLVILSNAQEISTVELNEAALVADTLLHNKCYEYFVDRRGTIYAGASLPYLFGKICGIHKTKEGIRAYISLLNKYAPDSAVVDELDYGLEELFHTMPALFIEQVLNDSDNSYLFPHIAWGFLNNVYVTYGALSMENYKDVFYKRYAVLGNGSGVSSKITEQVFLEIENVLR